MKEMTIHFREYLNFRLTTKEGPIAGKRILRLNPLLLLASQSVILRKLECSKLLLKTNNMFLVFDISCHYDFVNSFDG